MDLQGERNSWKTQLKNARLFLSPGLEWLITQAAMQELLSAGWSHPAQHTKTEMVPALQLFWKSVNRELHNNTPALEFPKVKRVGSAVLWQMCPCHFRVPSLCSGEWIFIVQSRLWLSDISVIRFYLTALLRLDHRLRFGLEAVREMLMGGRGGFVKVKDQHVTRPWVTPQFEGPEL